MADMETPHSVLSKKDDVRRYFMMEPLGKIQPNISKH
jgi:hypothetical protein